MITKFDESYSVVASLSQLISVLYQWHCQNTYAIFHFKATDGVLLTLEGRRSEKRGEPKLSLSNWERV